MMMYEHSGYTVLVPMNVCTQQVPQIVTYCCLKLPHPHINVAMIAYGGATAFVELGTPRSSTIRITSFTEHVHVIAHTTGKFCSQTCEILCSVVSFG
jgi:hypothetical protein